MSLILHSWRITYNINLSYPCSIIGKLSGKLVPTMRHPPLRQCLVLYCALFKELLIRMMWDWSMTVRKRRMGKLCNWKFTKFLPKVCTRSFHSSLENAKALSWPARSLCALSRVYLWTFYVFLPLSGKKKSAYGPGLPDRYFKFHQFCYNDTFLVTGDYPQ